MPTPSLLGKTGGVRTTATGNRSLKRVAIELVRGGPTYLIVIVYRNGSVGGRTTAGPDLVTTNEPGGSCSSIAALGPGWTLRTTAADAAVHSTTTRRVLPVSRTETPSDCAAARPECLGVSPRSVVRPTCLGGWWLRRPSATPRRSDGDIASQRQDVPAFEAAARGSGACRGLVAGAGGRGRRRQRAQRLEVGRPLPARGRAGARGSLLGSGFGAVADVRRA